MLVKVLDINLEYNENAGCNNGEFHDVVINTTCGNFTGCTCRCNSGCSGTWNINGIKKGMIFVSEKELFEQLEG